MFCWDFLLSNFVTIVTLFSEIWIFWCGTVHLRGPDGLTSLQRKRLAQQCEDLLWTDPSTLLDEDRYLFDLDFAAIGKAPSDTRQAWILEIEAARCATGFLHLIS
jgi:hypothetical protein